MSSIVYPKTLSKRVLVFVSVTLTIWLAATIGADGLVQPIQVVVRVFEQLFGLHTVPAPT